MKASMMILGLLLATVTLSESALVPGMKYCGDGERQGMDIADSKYPVTDNCCRIHDYCPHRIFSKTTEFGLSNPYAYTMSLCECDEQFRTCLLDDTSASSEISYSIGAWYFHVFGAPCFDLKDGVAKVREQRLEFEDNEKTDDFDF